MVVAKIVSKNVDIGLLLARIGFTLLFLYTGSLKLFGAFGGPGIEGFAGLVWGSLILAWLVGIVEFFGALFLLLGVWTREVSLLLAVVLFVATVAVVFPSGNMINLFIHVAMIGALFGLFFAGSGRFALLKD